MICFLLHPKPPSKSSNKIYHSGLLWKILRGLPDSVGTPSDDNHFRLQSTRWTHCLANFVNQSTETTYFGAVLDQRLIFDTPLYKNMRFCVRCTRYFLDIASISNSYCQNQSQHHTGHRLRLISRRPTGTTFKVSRWLPKISELSATTTCSMIPIFCYLLYFVRGLALTFCLELRPYIKPEAPHLLATALRKTLVVIPGQAIDARRYRSPLRPFFLLFPQFN